MVSVQKAYGEHRRQHRARAKMCKVTHKVQNTGAYKSVINVMIWTKAAICIGLSSSWLRSQYKLKQVGLDT